jgi:hypothetical protein
MFLNTSNNYFMKTASTRNAVRLVATVFLMGLASFSSLGQTSNTVVTTFSGVGDITQDMLDEVKSIEPILKKTFSISDEELVLRSIHERIIDLKCTIIAFEKNGNTASQLKEQLWYLEQFRNNNPSN